MHTFERNLKCFQYLNVFNGIAEKDFKDFTAFPTNSYLVSSAWGDTHRIFSGSGTFKPGDVFCIPLFTLLSFRLSFSLCHSLSPACALEMWWLAGWKWRSQPLTRRQLQLASNLEVHSALTFDSVHFVLQLSGRTACPVFAVFLIIRLSGSMLPPTSIAWLDWTNNCFVSVND